MLGNFRNTETILNEYGHECDNHGCTKQAIHSLIDCQDSFGAEYSIWCDDHYKEELDRRAKVRALERLQPTGYCEWCKTANVYTSSYRDMEEGMYGRVYDVCQKCISKDVEYYRQENEMYEQDDYYDNLQ